MWKAIRRWWRVCRGKKCWECGEDALITYPSLFHAGAYVVKCRNCNAYTVKGY